MQNAWVLNQEILNFITPVTKAMDGLFKYIRNRAWLACALS